MAKPRPQKGKPTKALSPLWETPDEVRRVEAVIEQARARVGDARSISREEELQPLAGSHPRKYFASLANLARSVVRAAAVPRGVGSGA